MHDTKTIFSIKAPENLYSKVIFRINEEKMQEARKRIFIWATAFAGSFVLCIYAVRYALENFYASEFSTYISLLMSDQGVVLAYWREFLGAIAGSIPLIAVCTVLGTVMLVLYALKQLIDSAQNTNMFSRQALTT